MRKRSLAGTAMLRTVWALMAAAMVVTIVPPAHADAVGLERVGTLDTRVPDDANFGAPSWDLILEPTARRGLQFIQLRNNTTIGRAVNLDTGRIEIEKTYPRTDFPIAPSAPHASGQSAEWLHAIDPEARLLYMPYSGSPGYGGINVIDMQTLKVVKQFPRPVVALPSTEPGDLGCTSSACLPQTPTASPNIKGMAFVPSLLTGLNPKLLFLMQEPSPPGTDSNFSLPWVAQMDIETGRQDWITRVSSCSSAILPGNHGLTRYQVPIFQARLGTGIYLACSGSGGIGQVVRLVVDASNKPTTEQAYPGPLGMIDAFADPAADRMLLRVMGQEGESWWVFDGQSSSYAGVIGSTAAPGDTTGGIDLATGRLYIQSKPSGIGRQRLPGGILMADSRRNPAPQALTFEEFAGSGRGRILVDLHPESGERRIFVLDNDGAEYTIYRDAVGISADPPLRDLDRLTVDVEEKAGETDVNFTGTGHAYGFRALFAGGIEGIPPAGPDISNIRAGRFIPRWLGSPCGPVDRELILGAVNSAGLSNNLSSASSSVAGGDAGSRQDLAQPTARCYPHPHPRDEDVWKDAEPHLGPYPRPLDQDADGNGTTDTDEYAGSAWPFRNTECSGEGTDETTVKVRPADRGGDNSAVPDQAREQEVEFSRWKSSVSCGLEAEELRAQARMLVHDETPAVEVPIGDLGTLRIAEVSSDVHIYRDAERGLVARSVARASGITLGDHFSIDQAIAIAEAWAAGRSGTASTSFVRALCGVTIKDEAPGTTVNRPSADVDQEKVTSGDPSGVSIDPEGGGEQPKNVNQQFCGDPDIPALGQQNVLDDEQPVIDALNRVLGARARVSAPYPDGELAQGTPGGYLASVQKDRLDAISSRAVNNDATNTVPALQMIMFNDDKKLGRGRQLYQFAGVDASVTYGIFLLNPPFDDFDDLPDILSGVVSGVPAPEVPSGYTPTDPYVAPPPRSGPITVLFQGVGFLLRSPKDALLAAAVWFILVAPMQLALRRRALKGIR